MGISFAYKYDGSVFIVVDSHYYGVVDRMSLEKPQNFKLWKVRGIDNVYMSYQGSFSRFADILKTSDKLITPKCIRDSRFDLSLIAKQVVPKLFSLCEEHQLMDPDNKGDSLKGEVLLVSKEHIVLIAPDGNISEYDDFSAIGTSDEAALGAYGVVDKIMEPIKIGLTMMDTIVKYARLNHYPIAIVDVKNDRMHIISRQTEFIKDTIEINELVE